MSDKFDIVSEEQIMNGEATDAYFERTEESLRNSDSNPNVVAEITETQYPEGDFKVFTGVKDVANLLEGLDIDVYCLEEGRMFNGGPVMRIEGNYLDFARYETALLGMLSHSSGIATNALEVRRSAPNTKVLSFGARHVHPSLGAIVERNSLIAGLDGFSMVAAEKFVGENAVGTMPHALILSSDDQEEAWNSFNEGVDDSVPRIALCDTYSDEVDEVTRAYNELGDDLDGVRLDTTSSRRGDFERIIKEVRWELDRLGGEDVDIIVSGGLGSEELENLRDLVDGFGVGGYISNADPLDFGLDIVRKNGEDISKRGKLSGVKNVYRSEDDHIVTLEDKSDQFEDLMKPLIIDGEIVRDFDIESSNDRLRSDSKSLLD